MIRILHLVIGIVLIASCHAQKEKLQLNKSQTISQVDRVYGISKFWQEANYNFAYFENIKKADFDSLYKYYLDKVINETDDYKYYRLLQRFCAELKDGHTNVFFPDYLINQVFTPPIKIKRIKDEIYIVNVGKTYVDLIPRGSKIIKVNNQPVLEYLDQNVYPYISGPNHIIKSAGAEMLLQGMKGSNITITIQKPNGFPEDIRVPMYGFSEKWYYPENKTSYKLVDFKQLDQKIAYVAINSFRDSMVVKKFIELLPQLYDQRGLIIDLRQNGGGNGKYAQEITKYMTDKSYFFGEQGSTRKHLASYKAWGAYTDLAYAKKQGIRVQRNSKYADYYYGNVWELEQRDSVINDVSGKKLLMPLVILISNQTASAAEDFLIGLDYLKRATFIGQKTFGSTGQPIFFDLPGGGTFRICTRKCTYPDGRKFVGIGIKPDIEIDPDLDYYLSQNDIVLDKGIEYLKNGIKNSR